MSSDGFSEARTRRSVETSAASPSSAKYSQCSGISTASAATSAFKREQTKRRRAVDEDRDRNRCGWVRARDAVAVRARAARPARSRRRSSCRPQESPESLSTAVGRMKSARTAGGGSTGQRVVNRPARLRAARADPTPLVRLPCGSRSTSEDALIGECQRRRQIDGRRGLSHAAFLVGDRDYPCDIFCNVLILPDFRRSERLFMVDVTKLIVVRHAGHDSRPLGSAYRQQRRRSIISRDGALSSACESRVTRGPSGAGSRRVARGSAVNVPRGTCDRCRIVPCETSACGLGSCSPPPQTNLPLYRMTAFTSPKRFGSTTSALRTAFEKQAAGDSGAGETSVWKRARALSCPVNQKIWPSGFRNAWRVSSVLGSTRTARIDSISNASWSSGS